MQPSSSKIVEAPLRTIPADVQSRALPDNVAAVLLDKAFAPVANGLVVEASSRGRSLAITSFAFDERFVYFRVVTKDTADIGEDLTEWGSIVASIKQVMTGRFVVESLYFSPAASAPSTTESPAAAGHGLRSISPEFSAMLLSQKYGEIVALLVDTAETSGRLLMATDVTVYANGAEGSYVYLSLSERFAADLGDGIKKGHIVAHIVSDMQSNRAADAVYFSPEGEEPPAGSIRN